MKKIVVSVFLCCLVFLSLKANQKNVFNSFDEFNGICEFYCSTEQNTNNFILSNISCGNGCFVRCNLKSAKYVYGKLTNVEGFKIEFDEKIDLSKFEIKILKEEKIDDMQISYGFSNHFSKSIFIDGKKANVQIVEKENSTVLASPIIFSSY